MSTAIYWFRNDLRMTDNPALVEACASSDRLVLAYAMPDATQQTRWGFRRFGPHRVSFHDQALQGLQLEIQRRNGALHVRSGPAAQAILALARETGADRVYCAAIAAPEEMAEVAELREAGLLVLDRWQCSLLDPADLPFPVADTPAVYTRFRTAVENAGVCPRAPVAAPDRLPPGVSAPAGSTRLAGGSARPAQHASFPFQYPAFHGSEVAALGHLQRYFDTAAPQTYKATRNGLIGTGYSTKLSPWLAVGALSARTVHRHLRDHESRFGANDSTYWIGFELLWRDYFRLLMLRHGASLFAAGGLRGTAPRHDPQAFARWCAGQTGDTFIDAAMHELAATGFLSNRMRQVAASYLVHDLGCDWRAGAAWFESQLIDYDVYSNQGNWLYIAGRGADPRGGRRFDPGTQAAQYDPDGAYQSLWRQADAAVSP